MRSPGWLVGLAVLMVVFAGPSAAMANGKSLLCSKFPNFPFCSGDSPKSCCTDLESRVTALEDSLTEIQIVILQIEVDITALEDALACQSVQSCNDVCVDTDVDEANCGACGVTCGTGETCCGGGCIDTDTDLNNCGGCGITCVGDEICDAGLCIEF
jgi:hypothetical protein